MFLFVCCCLFVEFEDTITIQLKTRGVGGVMIAFGAVCLLRIPVPANSLLRPLRFGAFSHPDGAHAPRASRPTGGIGVQVCVLHNSPHGNPRRGSRSTLIPAVKCENCDKRRDADRSLFISRSLSLLLGQSMTSLPAFHSDPFRWSFHKKFHLTLALRNPYYQSRCDIWLSFVFLSPLSLWDTFLERYQYQPFPFTSF